MIVDCLFSGIGHSEEERIVVVVDTTFSDWTEHQSFKREEEVIMSCILYTMGASL